MTTTGILIGASETGATIAIEPRMANRHGLIAGATGTGKTVTLQRLAEGFSRQGVSVFLADVKGDLSGLSQTGTPGSKILERIRKIKLEGFQPRATPTVFWDVYGQKGHALRTTISEMGPLLLARLLDLNDNQEGTLQVLFKIADDQGLLLLDLKDLQALLGWAMDNAKSLKEDYGNLSSATLGTIQRKLLVLGESGGETFFGEPAIRLEHILQRDFSGNGVVSILDASHLMNDPRVYTSFMLWLLSELFEALPEVGDLDKPKLVFFFDEAHLLFNEAPKILLERIERVVRLVRSKGVGVYFVTQNPMDVPESVLGQLGNRIQHALRAFTPQDQKAVRTAAQTFRQNPDFDTEEAITQLAVGEALVSVLDHEGRPTPVERTFVAPPESRIGPAIDTERAEVVSRSPLKGLYDQTVDRESAFELLKKKVTPAEAPAAKPSETSSPTRVEMSGPFSSPSSSPPTSPSGPFSRPAPAPRPNNRQGVGEAFMKSTVRSIGSSLGRQILRGILGSILK